MNKKFLFAIMAIAAGLVFGSCASEEEQTEEVVEEIDTVAVDTVAIDTIAVDTVVEEPVAPAPKKAKKQTAKEPEPVVIIPAKDKKAPSIQISANKDGGVAVTAKKTSDTQESTASEKPKIKLNADKEGVKVAVKK